MRLTLFLLFLSLTQVLAGKIYSQSARISLNLKNSTIKEVLYQIETRSDYYFLFNSKLVDVNRKIDIEVTDEQIQQVLERLFEGQHVEFAIMDRQIVIQPAPDTARTVQQQSAVSGKVTDSAGAPLPGVTVMIKGTTLGTVTSADGAYVLTKMPDNAILVFSFVGMKTQEIPVALRNEIDVTMDEDAIGIEEVVAIGYGRMKKSDLTGSVSSADLEALKGTPNVNLLQGLQGTMPGLNVGMVDEAGENPSITVRGRSTISGNQSPLIILDGIVYYGNLSSINPNDIESFDILKDASSKAIYGAQAANGVILITTKRGGSEETPVVTYNASYSTGSPYKRLHSRDRESYLKMVRDIFWNEAYSEESGYTALNENYNIETSAPFTDASIVKGYNEGADTDWWDLGTTEATIMTQNIGIRGMTQRVNYFMSFGYDKQVNYIINDKFNRKTARVNLETQVTNWLKMGIQSFGAFSDYSGESPDLIKLAQAGPLRMPYDNDGNLVILGGDFTNPLIGLHNNDLDKRNELFGNFYAKISNISFLPGFSWDINYGNTLQWVKQFNSNRYAQAETGEVKKYNNSMYSYTFDNILSYVKTLDKHRIDATLVIGQTEREYENTTARSNDLANQTLGYNDLGQGKNQFVLSDSWEESSSYQMFRLNYSYRSKYLLTGTIRRDGFSGFAQNEKTAYFPSFAFGWIASEESFLNRSEWLDLLKLRASYGVNGNLVTRYSSLATVASSAAYVFGDGGTSAYGQEPSNLPNSNLRWERTRGVNFALDFGVLNNRVTGNVEYYRTTTKDLIWKKALPELTGFKEIIDNIGEIANRGIEITLNTTPVQHRDFRWDLTFAYAKNKNRIVHLLGDVDGDGKEDDLLSSNLFIGQPISAVYHYDVQGVYQIGDNIPDGFYAGSYKIVDHTGEGALSAADRTLLGMADPSYRFSIHNSFRYKGFSLKVFLNSVQAGKRGYLANNDPFAAYTPQFISQKGLYEEVDFWTPSNPNAEFRSPSGTSSINPNVYQKRSFVRLQDVVLSYDFSSNLLSKIRMQALRLYVSGKNLHTWTKWGGWDPETGSGLGYDGRPVLKYFTVGIELTLK